MLLEQLSLLIPYILNNVYLLYKNGNKKTFFAVLMESLPVEVK